MKKWIIDYKGNKLGPFPALGRKDLMVIIGQLIAENETFTVRPDGNVTELDKKIYCLK